MVGGEEGMIITSGTVGGGMVECGRSGGPTEGVFDFGGVPLGFFGGWVTGDALSTIFRFFEEAGGVLFFALGNVDWAVLAP